MTKDREILLRKLEGLSVESLADRLEKAARKQRVDVDKLVDEAARWARRR